MGIGWRSTAALLLVGVGAVLVTVAGCNSGSNDTEAASSPTFSNAAVSQTVSNGQAQGIIVSAVGSVTAELDIGLLSLGVSVRANSAQTARDQAADAMSDLLDSIGNNGVDDEDIKTTQFSLSPEFDFNNGSSRVTGYRVTNTVSVKVRELERVPEVIDEAVGTVGDPIQISGVTFMVDETESLLSQARVEAMANAEAKAQQLADLGGVVLGKPIAISEGAVSSPPVFFDARAFAETADAAPTPIEPGQLELSVSVQVTYEIL